MTLRMMTPPLASAQSTITLRRDHAGGRARSNSVSGLVSMPWSALSGREVRVKLSVRFSNDAVVRVRHADLGSSRLEVTLKWR